MQLRDRFVYDPEENILFIDLALWVDSSPIAFVDSVEVDA